MVQCPVHGSSTARTTRPQTFLSPPPPPPLPPGTTTCTSPDTPWVALTRCECLGCAHRDPGRVFRGGTHLRTLKGHTASVTGLDVMPLSGHLASCSIDCTIRVWDYKTATVIRMYNHYEEMKCLALRADTDEIVVGTEQANILRFPAGEEVGTITARQAMEAAMEKLGVGDRAGSAAKERAAAGVVGDAGSKEQ